MSHFAAHPAHAQAPAAAVHPELSKANITLAPGAGKGLSTGVLALGAILIGAAAAMGKMHVGGVWATQALAAYHLATMGVLAMSLGAMFFVMVFHLTNAGWTGTLRRQFENVASFAPFAFLMILPTLAIEIFVSHGHLFSWLSTGAAANEVLQKKWAYYFGPFISPAEVLKKPVGQQYAFPVFFALRAVIYGGVWTFLSRRLLALSREQDATGSGALTARARFMSAWGMPLFALTTAFAAFDWLMGVDFAFASTMWGVYYFAGAAFSAAALMVMIFAILRLNGKLEGAVTHEHFHDLGKLMFTFTIFWAYIGFSQYFLIWYSNIPEETAFYIYRANPQWINLSRLLIVGHFVAPFLVLLFRRVKRDPKLLIIMAAWAIFLEFCDMYWIVRPMVYARAGTEPVPAGTMALLVDVVAILGVLAMFAGYLIWKIPRSSLVAFNDPYIEESLHHRNYV